MKKRRIEPMRRFYIAENQAHWMPYSTIASSCKWQTCLGNLYLVERWSCKNKELIEGEDPRFKSHFSSFPIVMKALSCSDICNASEGGRIYERYWWWRCFWRIKEESSSFPFILWCCDPYIIGIKPSHFLAEAELSSSSQKVKQTLP